MSAPRFSTFGYGRESAWALTMLIQRQPEMLLADIRMMPRSRIRGMNKGNLERVLGAQYQHVPTLGNKHYKRRAPTPIAIVNLEGGIAHLEGLGEGRHVILLCQCEHYAGCHRRVVAEALVARGHPVEEIQVAGFTSNDEEIHISVGVQFPVDPAQITFKTTYTIPRSGHGT